MKKIETELKESVLIIRINRPEKKNAITLEMYQALSQAMDQAEENSQVKAIVFSSTSGDLSAGNDLKDFRDHPPITDDAPAFEFIRRLARFEKPMIAAANGLAVGIGLTMLMHCDFVYVSETSKLMAPFVNLGIVPEAGSSLSTRWITRGSLLLLVILTVVMMILCWP